MGIWESALGFPSGGNIEIPPISVCLLIYPPGVEKKKGKRMYNLYHIVLTYRAQSLSGLGLPPPQFVKI